MKVFAVMISIGAFQETAFGNSDFDKPEPSYLNRHWTLHGRSHRDFTKMDYIKMLLSLDALIFMANLAERTEEKTDEL